MRSITRTAAKFLTGWLLSVALIGLLFPQPAVAIASGSTRSTAEIAMMPDPETSPTNYSEDRRQAIKQFLTSQPDRHYGILSVEALKKALSADRSYPLQQEVVLIDVRTPEEYTDGHIPTAANIPVEVLVDHLQLIPRDKTVVVYCSSGYRAAMAVESLHLLGYDTVQGFAPGFKAWREAGEAIEIG